MGTSMPMDTSMQILDIVQSCAEACDGDYGLRPETAVHALSALVGVVNCILNEKLKGNEEHFCDMHVLS